MRLLETRIRRVENRAKPSPQPRIVVLNQGESTAEALARLKVSDALLEAERRSGRRLIFVRWAG